MHGILAALRDATVKPFRDAMTRMATDVAAGLAIAGLAILGVGFAIAAAWIALAEHVGGLAACGILSGTFVILAGILLGLHRVERARWQRDSDEAAARRRAAQASIGMVALVGKQLTRAMAGSTKEKGLVRSAGGSRTRRSNPWILIAMAMAAGFAGSRLMTDDSQSDE